MRKIFVLLLGLLVAIPAVSAGGNSPERTPWIPALSLKLPSITEGSTRRNLKKTCCFQKREV